MTTPPLFPTRIHRRGIQAQFGGSFDDIWLHWEGIATFRARGGHTLDTQAHTTDADTLSLFAQSEAQALLAFQQGCFLLHASAVLVRGQAYVFAGTPGAGKSSTTAAFVKAGYAPLADDITTIRVINHQPHVLPDGPTIKIWDNTAQALQFSPEQLTPCTEGHRKYYHTFAGNYPTEPIPLAGMFLLHRSNQYPKTKPIEASEVAFELIKHFPLPHQLLQGEALKRHFKDSLLLHQYANVIRLKRPKGFEKLIKFVRQF